MTRYIQRDVPPALAEVYAPPKAGVVRAGNGRYWQRGIVRSEATRIDGRFVDEGYAGHVSILQIANVSPIESIP